MRSAGTEPCKKRMARTGGEPGLLTGGAGGGASFFQQIVEKGEIPEPDLTAAGREDLAVFFFREHLA